MQQVRLVEYEFDISEGGNYNIIYVTEFSGRLVEAKHRGRGDKRLSGRGRNRGHAAEGDIQLAPI